MTHQPSALAETPNRPDLIRDGVAAVLLILGLLLPWNVYFGLGISGTLGWVFAVLVLVTLVSLAALVVSEVGRRRIAAPAALAKLRLVLNVPYLVVVAGFTLFSIVIAVRYGGTGVIPPGVGPGAWAGVAGALLAAQPLIRSDDNQHNGARACRVIGLLSIALAVFAALFNLYFRTRFVLPGIGGEAPAANLLTAVTAVVYSAVAAAPVLIAGRWIISGKPTARLAAVLLGSSALVAGALVWIFPVGRDLDSFHGIAQNTGTAGVGYEGYLVWAAAGAIVGTATLRGALTANSSVLWRKTARLCLVLIAVWCGGTAMERILDVALASVLGLPAPPYNSTALMAFDLITAVLALWLFLNSATRAAPRTVMALLFGVLFVLTMCRLILGVVLVPRVQPLNPGVINDVFGNELAQQITSTFDLTLGMLSLAMLASVLAFGDRTQKAASQQRPAQTAAQAVVDPGQAMTPPRSGAGATPEIAWADPAKVEAATRPEADRIAEALAQSTRRFAAGTTYGGAATSTEDTPTVSP